PNVINDIGVDRGAVFDRSLFGNVDRQSNSQEHGNGENEEEGSGGAWSPDGVEGRVEKRHPARERSGAHGATGMGAGGCRGPNPDHRTPHGRASVRAWPTARTCSGHSS